MGTREILLTIMTIIIAVSAAQRTVAQSVSEKLKKLTAENVSEFIEDVSILTSNQNLDRDDAKIAEYLDRHISKKASFRTSITYMMPGLPDQEKVLTLKKDDYIEHIKKGADSVDHYHSEVEIGDVKISKSKKSASVTTVTTESGIMQIPGEEGEMEEVSLDGRSECFQVFRLGKKGFIEMHSANCTTIMQFLPY